MSLNPDPYSAAFLTDFRREKEAYRDLIGKHTDATELVCQSTDTPPVENWRDLAETVCEVFIQRPVPGVLRQGYRPHLFIGHGPWQPDNRLTRHHRLWGAPHTYPPHLSRLPQDEVIVESAAGIRFFAIVRLDTVSLRAVLPCLWSGHFVATVFFSRKDVQGKDAATPMFNEAFGYPADQAETRLLGVNWVQRRIAQDDLVVWPSGSSEEGAARLHLIGNGKSVPEL